MVWDKDNREDGREYSPTLNDIERPRIIRGIDDIDESLMSDIFDLFKELIKVHSKNEVPELSTDFVIADLSEDVATNKLLTYVVEQLRVAKALSEEVQDPVYSHKVKEFIMTEVHAMVVMTRSAKGAVLKSVLKFPLAGMGEQPVDEDEQEKKGFWGKLLSKSKE